MNRFCAVTLLSLVFISPAVVADSDMWTVLKQSQRSLTELPQSDSYYRVDNIKLRQQLSRATYEGRSETVSEIELPVENGEIQRFKVEESPVMAAGLAAKYPEIKSYKIYGIDNPYASGRVSMSPKGFHGMITDPSGTFYIDPASDDVYRAYSKKSQTSVQPFNCGVAGHNHQTPVGTVASRSAYRTAGSLRVYRLAVATTGEYVEAVGDMDNDRDVDQDDAIIEINTAINRVNQIYERDLGIRLELINQNQSIIYSDKLTDPYTDPFSNANDCAINNTCASTGDLLNQNVNNLNNVTVLGPDNYDIGHVFSRGGGGLAEVGSVCEASRKAGGVTGLPNPVSDVFYIDFVAHEMGHQFSAEHSFNGTTDNCSGINRVPASAFEPGSGSSIMSYAGICAAENIVNHADAIFHAGSVNLIDSFTTSGSGANCGTLNSIFNPSEPKVDAGSDFTIPRKTPFVLTVSGSDADNDPVTYSWDQMDAGTATNATTLGTDLGNNSLFRSYLPRSENSRHFPAFGTTFLNQYDDSENLACKTRSMNFRVTVHDGNSGIGTDNVRLSVDNGSGPFQITSFNQRQLLAPGGYVINWDVANTNNAPVSCPSVDISLLTFNASRTSYAETPLAANVTNDGLSTITLPDNSSSAARFKIQCSDNVFYDISDADLTITGNIPFSTTGNTVNYNEDGLLIKNSPTEDCLTIESSSSSGGGSLGVFWLFSLFSVTVLRWKPV